jgi:predicted alpha/beta superfamily hydrolase
VSLSYPPFRSGRQCWVYLPPGYAQTDRRYPVLYLNDGETAFDGKDGMHVNRICEDLIRRGEMAPIIVVAVETAGQRTLDYTPWVWSYWQPNGGGDAYLQAVRDTLKPEVDRRYRTITDSGHTAMCGTSLGGLIAVYAAYAFESTFGIVGALSPPYFYAASATTRMAALQGRPPHFLRFYQDTGYPDDNSIGDMEAIAIDQGFALGVDLMSLTAPGGDHSAMSWEHRMPGMLSFLFPAPGDNRAR